MSQLTFNYLAMTTDGDKATGSVRAMTRNEAFRQISAKGLKPTRIRAARRRRRKKVSVKELSQLTRQFAVLLEAGIPIVDGLNAIAEQVENPSLGSILEEVANDISSGRTVTQSLEVHRAVFGDVYIETIRAAETSGNMPEVLANLAEILDRQYETTKSVKSALLYPICVVVALAVALTFLMVFVVPKFADMFMRQGLELPLPTQIVVGFSNFLRTYWYLCIGGVVGTIWGFRHAWRRPSFRRRVDSILHRVPYIRTMLVGLAVSRFTHILNITLRSGLSLIEALEMSGKSAGRPLLEADVRKMCRQVRSGGRLGEVLTTCTYLPPFARRMLITGDESAELTKLCDVVAEHYDREVAHMTKGVATVIEPFLIAGLAGIVLIVALAIFLPMWEMGALMGAT